MTTTATEPPAQVHILIVDDDEVTRLVLHELLKDLCRELLAAATPSWSWEELAASDMGASLQAYDVIE